jgi:hypothetical protein
MIPDRALQLLDKEGFIAAYYEGVRAGQSCKEAFEAVNQEYYMFFKKYKYADYNSFRHVRDYEHRKIKRRVKRFLKKL